jgi:hypothetical protein
MIDFLPAIDLLTGFQKACHPVFDINHIGSAEICQ